MLVSIAVMWSDNVMSGIQRTDNILETTNKFKTHETNNVEPCKTNNTTGIDQYTGIHFTSLNHST